MRKLLIVPFLIISFICSGQYEKEWNRVIGKPIRIGDLEVAQNDFEVPMGSEDAKEFCAKLGKGWRLPTKDELLTLFEKRREMGKDYLTGHDVDNSGEPYPFYWSSTADDKGKQWWVNMSDGRQFLQRRPAKGYFLVRAVRLF